MITKEEKFEKALGWLENASYNCNNILRTNLGTVLVPMIKEQIDNAIKYLKDEEVGEDVF